MLRLPGFILALALLAVGLAAPAHAQISGGVQQQGAVVANDCVKWVRNGVIADTGAACGGGGSSTITAGSTVTSGFTDGHFIGSSGNLAVDQTAVTSVSTACGLSGGPITATGTIQATANPTTEAGANYAFLAADMCTTVYLNNASNQVPTIPQANTAGFENGKFIEVCNIGAGTQTITPTTSTIGGASTYVLPAGTAAAPKCVGIIANGSNYTLDLTGNGGTVTSASVTTANGVSASTATPTTTPAFTFTLGAITPTTVNGNTLTTGSGTLTLGASKTATISNTLTFTGTDSSSIAFGAGGTIGGLGYASPGTGVVTAATANLSAAGGLTTTIASGTSAMGTGAITSATCATVVTTAATNTATTDVVLASFNGDPTAVTGYVPLTTGMLTIIAYPTSGNVNFKVCNNTSGSITPGAITLNWRVLR